jgi:hypothetical protein
VSVTYAVFLTRRLVLGHVVRYEKVRSLLAKVFDDYMINCSKTLGQLQQIKCEAPNGGGRLVVTDCNNTPPHDIELSDKYFVPDLPKRI